MSPNARSIHSRRPTEALRIAAAAMFLVALGCPPATASPQAGATPGEAPGEAKKTVDHSAFTALLERYVDADGLVDYETWKAKDVAALESYLEALSAVEPAKLGSQEERIAFWINVYNALTIQGIIEFYPLKSIKDKVSRLFGYNIWDDYKIAISGEEYSLNRIEHKILRPLGEPRIHFALVCASIGCPKLRREAYTGTGLDAQLAAETKGFLNDPTKTRVDLERGKVHLSKIFDWFGEDFGGSDAKILEFVAPYRPESERKKLRSGKLDVDFLDYDWSLNEQKP